MRGMGDQVIRVPLDVLQSMMSGQLTEVQGWLLPKSVDIIDVIDPVDNRNPWVPDERENMWGKCVYLRIQHKYCMRRPKGSPLTIEDYHPFIERFNSILKSEISQ